MKDHSPAYFICAGELFLREEGEMVNGEWIMENGLCKGRTMVRPYTLISGIKGRHFFFYRYGLFISASLVFNSESN